MWTAETVASPTPRIDSSRQGQSRNASPQVLDAIASALRLTGEERVHLLTLASNSSIRFISERPKREVADPALLQLVHSVGDVPALILGRRSDVLAWNPAAHALLAMHLPYNAPHRGTDQPNMAEAGFFRVITLP